MSELSQELFATFADRLAKLVADGTIEVTNVNDLPPGTPFFDDTPITHVVLVCTKDGKCRRATAADFGGKE